MLGMNGGESEVVARWWREVGVVDAGGAGQWLLDAARRMGLPEDGLPREYVHFDGELQTEITERLRVAGPLQFWVLEGGAREVGDSVRHNIGGVAVGGSDGDVSDLGSEWEDLGYPVPTIEARARERPDLEEEGRWGDDGSVSIVAADGLAQRVSGILKTGAAGDLGVALGCMVWLALACYSRGVAASWLPTLRVDARVL